MSWLHYLIEANIYLGVFYLCYCLLLNRDTHYTLSRAYLLFSCVVAFVLPVTQLSILKPLEQAAPEMAYASNINMQVNFIPPPPPPAAPGFTIQDAFVYAYALGVLIALIVFAFRLYKLFKLSRVNRAFDNQGYRVIHLQDDNTAFSFFNYLFIGADLSQSETIIQHELVHIRQKHSVDIVFLELLKVINWFNPFVYLLQRSLKTVHEYIADEHTAAYEQDALTYSSFLLNNAYGIQGSSIAHSFFNYNLLKKRIIMLNQKRSGKLARLKYLTALPLCAGMLCASTLAFSKDYAWIDLSPKSILPEASTMVKRLKILNDGLTIYSDNVSVTEKNGTHRKYHVSTITPADIRYLLIRHKMKVEIIEVDSAAEKRNPAVYLPDAPAVKGDTIKKKLPPPPPALPKAKASKLPPPPPALPKGKISELQPPPPPPIERPSKAMKRTTSIFKSDKTQGGLAIAPPLPGSDKDARLAPPPPYEVAYVSLYNYMAKHVRYPTKAFENQVTGNIITSYRLDNDHKITDIKTVNGIGSGCDEEVVRALKAFNSTIDKAPGTYYMATIFALQGYTKKFEPVGDIRFKPNFAGTIVIMGYPPLNKTAPETNGKVTPHNDEEQLQKPAQMPNSSRALLISELNKKSPAVKISSVKSPTFTTIDKNKSIRLKARPNRGGNIAEILDKNAVPLVFVNGTRHLLKETPKNSEHLYMTASDSMVIHIKGEVFAAKKWGEDAKNGVVELFGNTSVYIK